VTHREKLQRKAQRVLRDACGALQKEGLSVRAIVVSGSPARVLLKQSLAYDLTVIGAHSRRSISNGWLGPVASRLIEHASGSVLVGRDPRNDVGVRVLAAIDGSDVSLRALDQMIRLLDLRQAEVTLIHVVETPWLHGGSEEDWVEIDSLDEIGDTYEVQMETELEREAEETLLAARKRLPDSIMVSTLVYRGIPAQEILTEADTGDYDVIVMGASGENSDPGDLKYQMLGSVSTKVAWNACCSVLLIRPGSED
jgi:nucleotide-binding universal stress UspA family protein